MSEAWRCREEGDGLRDGRMRVEERQSGKVNIYLFVSRKDTMLLCCSECALRAFSEMIMCGTLGLLERRRRTVKGERDMSMRRGRKR